MTRLKLFLLALAAFLVYYYARLLLGIGYTCYWWSWHSQALTQVDSTAIQPGSVAVVPRRIHQTWKDAHVPERWQRAQRSCQALHPEYEYKLWTDEDGEQLIAAKYPWFLKTFRSYPYGIQRADAIRYFILYEYGGIYLDLDIACKERLDFLLHYDFITPKTTPIGVSNDIMVAKQHDPFVLRLIQQLARWKTWLFVRYGTVMFSTGPMFVTIQYSLYEHKERLSVLATELYGHRCFRHVAGSSWHGPEVRVISWISSHPLTFIGMLAVFLGSLLAAGLLLSRRHWRRKRRQKPH